MTGNSHTSVYRPGIQAMLHEHEQMGAWLFFCIMSFLVMSYIPAGLKPPIEVMAAECSRSMLHEILYRVVSLRIGGHLFTLALHSIVIGIWLLYCLKTASLFVRRSTAWAITGIVFIYCTGFFMAPAEIVLAPATISLYHILVWARGKKDSFPPRHLFLAGLGMGIGLLATESEAIFWLPIIVLMLWVNRGQRIKGALIALSGLASVLGMVFLIGISYIAATQGMASCGKQVSETIQHLPQIIQNSSLTLGGIGNSILLTEPLTIFRGTLPLIMQASIPAALALIPGHFLMFLWMRPFRKIRRRRKIAINSTLFSAYATGFYIYFCTATPVKALYFYPFILISIIGIVLIIRRWVIFNRRTKRILRGVGLMLPFVTLVTIMLIPVLEQAFSPAEPIQNESGSAPTEAAPEN